MCLWLSWCDTVQGLVSLSVTCLWCSWVLVLSLSHSLQVLLPSSVCLHQRSRMESHAGPSERWTDTFLLLRSSSRVLHPFVLYFSSSSLSLSVLSVQRRVMGTACTDCVATCVWTAPVSRRRTPSNWSSNSRPTPGWDNRSCPTSCDDVTMAEATE